MLFTRVQKALYRMLKIALLFYKKLGQDLETYGYKINPYDPCGANKFINGYQMTVVWHVDDLKVSHECAQKVTKMATCYSKSIWQHQS